MARSKKKNVNLVVPVVDDLNPDLNGDNSNDDHEEEEYLEADEEEDEENVGHETGSTSDTYSDEDEEQSEEESDDDSNVDDEEQVSKDEPQVNGGHRIEYESPDAINCDDDDDQSPKKRLKTGHKSNGQQQAGHEQVEEDGHGQEAVPKKTDSRPKLFKSAFNKSKRLIVILERANLELVKTRNNSFELINCDDHMSLIRKYRKDPAFCRPDITHQCLLMLFDSPLNRAGMLQVYIHTINNILIEINPQTRFPRTFKRFANLMVQLLYKMSIKSASAGGNQKLLKVIKNPITSHLPVGCKKWGTSFQSDNLIQPSDLVPTSTDLDGNQEGGDGRNVEELPVVVVIGAMAHGQTGADYVEETVSISQYPLSGALACSKICSAFEQKWGIH